MGSHTPEMRARLIEEVGAHAYDPKRRTGRTTRMLLAAAQAILDDEFNEIVLVATTTWHARHLERRLREILQAAGVTLRDNESIRPIAADGLRSIHPRKTVFADHSVLEGRW